MRSRILAATLVAACTATLAFAEDPKPKTAPGQAEMEAMMKAATPGDAHKKLNAMAGTWDAKVKFWAAPGAAPQESTGTSVNEWVLGGRWLQQKFESSMMGAPFSGIGYTGYDNIRQTYVGTWMDTMSTSFMNSSGGAGADPSGKTWNFTATMLDPVSGEPTNADEKMTMVDADHHVWEMWAPGPDGRNYKMMEITYSRKK